MLTDLHIVAEATVQILVNFSIPLIATAGLLWWRNRKDHS